MLNLVWQRYLQQLQARPLKTKALTSAFIAGLSDVIAQNLISGGYRNWQRTLAIAIYGLVWNGGCLPQHPLSPCCACPAPLRLRLAHKLLLCAHMPGPSAHFWQKFMEFVFQGKSDIATVLKKVRGGPGLKLSPQPGATGAFQSIER